MQKQATYTDKIFDIELYICYNIYVSTTGKNPMQKVCVCVVVRKEVNGESLYLFQSASPRATAFIGDILEGETASRAAQRVLRAGTGIFVRTESFGQCAEMAYENELYAIMLWAGQEISAFPELNRRQFVWLPYDLVTFRETVDQLALRMMIRFNSATIAGEHLRAR